MVQITAAVAMTLLIASGSTVHGQRTAQRRATTGPVTFAIQVTDTKGAPLGGVAVSVDGPVTRRATTEAGRIAFENMPTGTYHFTFERDGYYVSEKNVVGRGRAPIDVKVAMMPRIRPVPGLAPVAQPPAAAPGKPVALDLPAFIEKNYVGRASGKILPIACSAGGSSTLIQINDPLSEHTHADADEFLYVIAGAGTARVTGQEEPLTAGMFLLVPRRAAHSFRPSGKGPLVMLSMRAGEPCADR